MKLSFVIIDCKTSTNSNCVMLVSSNLRLVRIEKAVLLLVGNAKYII